MDVASVPAARAVLDRLAAFLDRFAGGFGRRPQRQGASRYVDGVLNDRDRKSMQAAEQLSNLSEGVNQIGSSSPGAPPAMGCLHLK